MHFQKFWSLLLLPCLLTACAPALTLVAAPTFMPITPTQASSAQDLFPFKAELHYAKAFKVEYHNTYKVVTVLQPWRDANRTFEYILVQRGTPIPANTGNAEVIEIPVRSIASLSTTHLPYWAELDQLDKLVAVGNAEYVNTPGVVERLKAGTIQGVGNGPEVNIEKLLSLQPELVTTLALGNTNKDDYQQLLEKGFKVVIVSDFMEETPLGRAEWVKFMALFTNQEAQAEAVFEPIEQHYLAIQKLGQSAKGCPTVVMGFEINGSWNMPGGKNYQGAYIHDAGGCYLWADDDSTGRIPLSFEAVYQKAATAEYWFNQSDSWLNAGDILAADPRYENFSAFAEGHVYNDNARLNTTGGNDYNESGQANPDVILADLISILHPELLPSHVLVYYRPLNHGASQK
ncbi:MAG TPA: ABC transporter substrate-binding protein [Longilinea sp.]|nr:ABC transporter substrate-binding protein [Longilinea sp.]